MRLSIEEVQRRVHEIHGFKLTLDVLTYVDVTTKCRFVDSEYGEWWVKPDNVFSGQQHPERKRKRLTCPIENVQLRVFEKHGNIVTIDESTYVNSGVKARFVDSEYGEWWVCPGHVMCGEGHPVRGRKRAGLKHVRPLMEIKDRIKVIHGDELIIVDSTYVNSYQLATFVDKTYGEFFSKPGNILQGHCHPMRGALKRNTTLTSNPPQLHWKTNEICRSQSTWEHATLLWLNKNKIDFDWQIPFLTPFKSPKIRRNSIYIVDLYMKDGIFPDTYVEIKGYWRNYRKQIVTSKQKWEWFHNENKNSQLWMKKELVDLGIIEK